MSRGSVLLAIVLLAALIGWVLIAAAVMRP